MDIIYSIELLKNRYHTSYRFTIELHYLEYRATIHSVDTLYYLYSIHYIFTLYNR